MRVFVDTKTSDLLGEVVEAFAPLPVTLTGGDYGLSLGLSAGPIRVQRDTFTCRDAADVRYLLSPMVEEVARKLEERGYAFDEARGWLDATTTDFLRNEPHPVSL